MYDYLLQQCVIALIRIQSHKLLQCAALKQESLHYISVSDVNRLLSPQKRHLVKNNAVKT